MEVFNVFVLRMLVWICWLLIIFLVGLLFVRNSIIGKLFVVNEFFWWVILRRFRVKRRVLLMLVLFFVFMFCLIKFLLVWILLLVVSEVEGFYFIVLLLNRMMLNELFVWSWLRIVNMVWCVCLIFWFFIELLMLMMKIMFFGNGFKLLGEKYWMKKELSIWIILVLFLWWMLYLLWGKKIKVVDK